MHIQFSSKDPTYPCFAQKTIDIQNKSKDAMYLLDEKHNEYPTSAHSNTILSHN